MERGPDASARQMDGRPAERGRLHAARGRGNLTHQALLAEHRGAGGTDRGIRSVGGLFSCARCRRSARTLLAIGGFLI